MNKICIVGYGYVGQGYHKAFPEAVIYDEPKKIGERKLVNDCDLATQTLLPIYTVRYCGPSFWGPGKLQLFLKSTGRLAGFLQFPKWPKLNTI